MLKNGIDLHNKQLTSLQTATSKMAMLKYGLECTMKVMYILEGEGGESTTAQSRANVLSVPDCLHSYAALSWLQNFYLAQSRTPGYQISCQFYVGTLQ